MSGIHRRLLSLLLAIGFMGLGSTAARSDRNWRMVGTLLGLGYVDRGESGALALDDGVMMQVEVLPLAFGIETLGGLGLGVTVFEGRRASWTDGSAEGDEPFFTGLPASLAVPYIYFPILLGEPDQVRGGVRKARTPFAALFLGGSAWGFDRNYLHGGIKYLPFMFGDPHQPIGRNVLCFGVQAGFFRASSYRPLDGLEVPPEVGWYAAVVSGWGGVFE